MSVKDAMLVFGGGGCQAWVVACSGFCSMFLDDHNACVIGFIS